jgi:hypothetical protein
MTDLDALTAACIDDPDDEARLAVLSDWLEEHDDARADAVRRVRRWRALVSAASAEEVPDEQADEHPGEAWALLENTAKALGQADGRLWACACLRRLLLLEAGAGTALLADPRRRRVVAAVELFACRLLGADELRTARAVLGLVARVSRREVEADPGRVVVWALAEPEVGRAAMQLLGAAFLFLGRDGGRFRRGSSLARQAVAAADRLLRERRLDEGSR